MYTIVIPTLSNSKYFKKCIEYIEKNSTHEHEILPIIDEKDVYYAYNKGVYNAKYDTVVLLNDDMIVSKDWDRFIPEYSSEKLLLTGYVFESNPGSMLYGPQCYKRDCGDFDNFDYDKFQHLVDNMSESVDNIIHGKMGWYMPLVVNQRSFISYPNLNKFPWYANDVILLRDIYPSLGYKMATIKMFVYHFSKQSTKEIYSDEQLRNIPPENI